MSGKMNRLQKLIDKELYIRGNFVRLPDNVKYMINYIFLDLNDDEFYNYIKAINVTTYQSYQIDGSFSPQIQSISVEHDNTNSCVIMKILFSSTDYIIIVIPVFLYAVRGQPLSRTLKFSGIGKYNTFFTRLRLCTIRYATGLNCTTLSYYKVGTVLVQSVDLSLFAEDIENGVDRYLRDYLVANKEYATEILNDSIEEGLNELTMTILRICEEENIHPESVNYRL